MGFAAVQEDRHLGLYKPRRPTTPIVSGPTVLQSLFIILRFGYPIRSHEPRRYLVILEICLLHVQDC
jgi:hypothetical protein